MSVKLKPQQIQTIKSMNKYWEEIANRDDKKHMAAHELNQMLGVVGKLDVLLIVSEYVKNYDGQKDMCQRLFDKIRHGDQEHQDWLLKELKEFFEVKDEPVK